jgi:hypothetical protein
LKQGENFQNLESAFRKSFSYTFSYLQYLKELFQKFLQKQASGANMVQNAK